MTVVHVFRAFAEAVPSVVKRAIAMGRVVTLDNIAATHFRSRETLFKLVEEFGAQINICIVENRAKRPLQVISDSELANRAGNDIDQLRELAHTVFDDEFASLKSENPEIHEAFLKKGSGG